MASEVRDDDVGDPCPPPPPIDEVNDTTDDDVLVSASEDRLGDPIMLNLLAAMVILSFFTFVLGHAPCL